MKCEVCGRDLVGDIVVRDPLPNEKASIPTLVPMPEERDWIWCNGCDQIVFVCHNCCLCPVSGFCNACINNFNLSEYLAQVGLIPKRKGHSI
ncbi:MAG: hypothetical protein HYR76_01185 [Ignavibacteria bacterium]|nr:hypothetical protein [Ignavibacteria bacterium]